MKIFFLSFFILISLTNKSQISNKFYTKYGGDGIDIGYDGKETYNKHYVLIGSTSSFGALSTDAYLLLIDSLGQLVWQKKFGGIASDIGKSILINPTDSGFIFTGYSNSFGNNGFDFYTVRTDKNGILIWQKTYGGADWEFANDLTLAQDGNIIVCGITSTSRYGKNDGYVIKLNVIDGSLIWEKKYGGNEDDELKTIKLTSDNKITIAGNTKSFGDLNGDYWLLKLNSNGDSLKSINLGSPNKKELCYDFLEDKTNKIVFCGSYDTSFNNIGKNISYLIKTDLNGIFIDDFKQSGAYTNEDKFYSICNSKNSNNYFLSRSVYNGTNSMDIQPKLITNNYTHIESTTYGGFNIEDAFKVINTSDNGFLMIGKTNSYDAISEDVFLLKLDSLLLNSNNIVSTKNHYELIKPTKLFKDNFFICFDNQNNELIQFKIHNASGQVVQIESTTYSKFQISESLPNGLYIVTSDKKGTLKFILSK